MLFQTTTQRTHSPQTVGFCLTPFSPIPDPNVQRAFTVVGVEVHLPPLARDAAEWTQKGAETTPGKP